MTVENCTTIAVIDIGSNSVRLVIYRYEHQVWQAVVNEKALCRLGEGVASSGDIQPERMTQALEAIKRFRILMDSIQPDQRIAIATSAVRSADNGPDFVRDASAILGFEPTVLSGQAEARYAGAGVRWSIPDARGMVCDLGGSSLELTMIDASGKLTVAPVSLTVGPLQLFDLFGNDRKAAKAYVDAQLRPAVKDIFAQSGRQKHKPRLYAVGGAWRALASLQMRAVKHPLSIIHRYRPKVRTLGDFLRPISFMNREQALALNVAQSDRRVTLPYAAMILRRLIKWSQGEAVEFCGAGIREGALALHANIPHQNSDCHRSPNGEDAFVNAVKSLVPNGGRFGPVGDAIEHWIAPALAANIGGIKDLSAPRISEACHLADFGWDAHPSHKKLQTYASILHSAVLPHDHHDRCLLAAIQYYRHAGRTADLNALNIAQLLNAQEQLAAKTLGRLIHLGMQICRAQADLLASTSIQIKEEAITIRLPNAWPTVHASSVKSSANLLSDACDMAVKVSAKRHQ